MCARDPNYLERCIFHSHPFCTTGRPYDEWGAFSMPHGGDMCRMTGSGCPTQEQLGGEFSDLCDPEKGSTVLLGEHPKAVITFANMYWINACDLVFRCASQDAVEVLEATLSSG